MKIIKRTTVILLLIFPALYSYPQKQADSVYVFRFVAGKDMFYSPFKNNGNELTSLMNNVKQKKEYFKDKKIIVNGSCNSKKSRKANRRIAKIRSNRVKSEVIVRCGLAEDNFLTENDVTQGDFVKVSVPSISVTTEPSAPTRQETTTVKDETDKEVVPPTTTTEINTTSTTEDSTIPTTVVAENTPTHFAIRANMLRWVTLTPDIGIEWHFTNHLSAVVNGSWTSFSWKNKDRRYALWEVMPEVRYYFTDWNKWYIGAQYKIGQFNYKLSGTGKQGDLQGGGFTFGYLLSLGKSWGIDFKLGAGYLHADYDTYSVINNVRIKDGNHIKNMCGITDLGITLVWKIK